MRYLTTDHLLTLLRAAKAEGLNGHVHWTTLGLALAPSGRHALTNAVRTPDREGFARASFDCETVAGGPLPVTVDLPARDFLGLLQETNGKETEK